MSPRAKPAAPLVLDERLTGVYVRLTRDRSLDNNLSAPAQIREAEEYVRRAGLPAIVLYQEKEATGGDVPFSQRRAASRLLDDIRAGKIGHIVARNLDRYVRSDTVWPELRDLCRHHDVQIHTTAGPLQLDTPGGRFATNVQVAAACLEREQTADRCRRAKREMARQGRHSGGPPPFGYATQSRRCRELIAQGLSEQQARAEAEATYPHRGQLVIDEAEAKIIKLIFDLYTERRMGCRQVCSHLNDHGFRRRSGLLWHPDKVRRIIADPTVAGFSHHDEVRFNQPSAPASPKDKQALYPGLHEAIITESQWLRAQEIRAGNRNPNSGKGDAGKANRKFPLSGVLQCVCGAAMWVKTGGRAKNANYYICGKRRDMGPTATGGCTGPLIATSRADEALWAGITGAFLSDQVIDQVQQAAWRLLKEENRSRPVGVDPAKQLHKLRKDLERWYDRHDNAANEVEQEAAWQRIVQLKNGQNELEALVQPPSHSANEPPVVTRDSVASFLSQLAGAMSQAEARGAKLVQALVSDHGLRVQVQSDDSLLVSVAIRPFASVFKSTNHAVVVERVQQLPKGHIDAWLEEQGGKHQCGICNKTIAVVRRHFWTGVPMFHRNCHVGQMAKHKNPDPTKYYTGAEAARRIGISRTELGRWVKAGEVVPVKRKSNVLLFRRSQIDKLADQPE